MRRLVAGLAVLLAAATGVGAAPSGALLIRRGNAGPARLGMTVAELRRVAPGLVLSRTSDGDGVALIAVRQGKRNLMTVFAGEEDPGKQIRESAKIEHIEVTSSGFRTTAGVRPGMLLRDVEKRYGRLKEIRVSEIESREFATFSRAPKGLAFRVDGRPGRPAGVYRSGGAAPGEVATKYRPSARIMSILIRG